VEGFCSITLADLKLVPRRFLRKISMTSNSRSWHIIRRVRVLVNCEYQNHWHVHCVAEDGKTIISKTSRIADEEAMIYLLRYIGAAEDDIASLQKEIASYRKGTIPVDLLHRRKNLLRVRRPWSDDLT
jgi:hypothetical protein